MKYDPEVIAINRITKIIDALFDPKARIRIAMWIYTRYVVDRREVEPPKPKDPETLPLPFGDEITRTTVALVDGPVASDAPAVCERHGIAGKCFACEAEDMEPGAKILATGGQG